MMVERKRTHGVRRSKRYLKYSLILTIPFIATCATLFMLYPNAIEESVIGKAFKAPKAPVVKMFEVEPGPTPVDYIREIDNPSSEKNDEWLGLCNKASIKTVGDFYKQVENDPELYDHFKNFKWARAEIKILQKDAKARVTHRKGEHILPSKKFITLPKGDGYITDGDRMVRTYCCNDIQPENADDFQPYTPAPKDPKEIVDTPIEYTIYEDVPIAAYTAGPFTEFRSNDGYLTGNNERRRVVPPPPPPPPNIPEPETILLFGSGLLVLLGGKVLKKFLTRSSK